jgi:hypothetical protein
MQGSLKQKGEEAKAVESYLTVNEIRVDILGYDPLPPGDSRGDKFVVEIKPAAPANVFDQALSVPAAPTVPLLESGDPVASVVEDTTLALKGRVVASQERIEKRLGAEYIKGYEEYLSRLLSIAERELERGNDPEQAMEESLKELARFYWSEVEKTLTRALERGFAFANAQSKTIGYSYVKKSFTVHQKKFNEIDQQAVDVLRQQQADKQRTILAERGISSFAGFSKNDTKRVMEIVAGELSKGRTMEQTAATLRALYTEAYKDQAFTIARTETLTAISQGMKWNHDVLGQIFTKVEKRWFHVGDVGSNPMARYNHYQFEQEGAVSSDYKWGGILEYPRDTSAPADETINCRCSMVTVIPDDADSNAEIILEND